MRRLSIYYIEMSNKHIEYYYTEDLNTLEEITQYFNTLINSGSPLIKCDKNVININQIVTIKKI